MRQRGVYRHGELGRDPPSRPRRRPQRACRLPRVQDPLEDPPEDPRQPRAARLSPHQAEAALDPRPLPAGPPSDPRGRQEGPEEAAAHRQADLRSAPGRARLPGRPDHGQGRRPGLAAQPRRGLRPAGPPARRGPGRLRPRRGRPRRPADQGRGLRHDPALLRRDLRLHLPPRVHRGVPRGPRPGLRASSAASPAGSATTTPRSPWPGSPAPATASSPTSSSG